MAAWWERRAHGLGRPPPAGIWERQAGSQWGAQPWGKVSSSGLDQQGLTDQLRDGSDFKTGFFLKVAKTVRSRWVLAAILVFP